MAKFHQLKVADVRRETADCVSVAFSVPEELKEEYNYIQGQYLTLKLQLNGEEVRRCYSLCSSPVTDDELRIAAKEVPGGAASPYLNREVKVGDALEVMTPMGSFHSPLDATEDKSYVFFAGGSGITPVMSIIKTVLAVEPQSKVTAFYANRNQQSIIFKDQLEALSQKHFDRFTMYHILDDHPEGNEIFTGMMSSQKVKALVESFLEVHAVDEFFICGPGPMMENVKKVLEHAKVAKEKIHIEYFTVVMDEVAEASASTAENDVNVNAQVTVIMDGGEVEFGLATDGPAILDAAAAAGVDAPFSCKGAMCATCRAKLKEGKVKMDKNFALADKDIEDGFILTCQSHPITEKVVVDYDEAV